MRNKTRITIDFSIEKNYSATKSMLPVSYTHLDVYKRQIVQIVLTAFLSMTFITFIGQNGRKIANGFENVTSQMLTETFVFGEKKEDPEIMNKQNIFDILQKQPFMVRHFGTTDLAKIAGSDDKDAIEKVGKRVQRLLNDP